MQQLQIKGWILILILGTAFTACRNDKAGEPSGKIQLGAIFCLTGHISDMGIPSSKGAQLAVSQLNEAGGIGGQTVDLILEDSKSDTAAVRQIAGKMLQEHPEIPLLFGISDSDLARTAGQVTAKEHRVFLTSGATSPLLPAQVPDYLYLACFGDNVQAAAAAEWAYSTLNARTVAVVYDSVETYTLLLHQYFISRFESLGGQVLAVQAYDPADMSRLGQGLPQADFIFLAAEAAPEAQQGVQLLRDAGITTPIVGGDGFDSEDLWEAHPQVKDVYYTTHVYLGADNPDESIQNFRQAYLKAYGGNTPDAFSALGYDTANLLADVIRRADSRSPEALRKALAETDGFAGITGTISYAGGRQVPRKSVTIIEVKDGKRRFVKQVVPAVIPNP